MLSNSWPTVPGKVTKSKVVRKNRIGSKGQTTYQYNIDFEYEYKVAGEKFKGKRLRFFHVYGNARKFVDSMAEKYPVDQTVDVFYNTRNPKSSVIQPGVSSGIFMFIIFFAVSIGSMSAVFYDKLF